MECIEEGITIFETDTLSSDWVRVGKLQTGKSCQISSHWHASQVKLPVLNNRHDCCGFSAVIVSEKCWRMLPGHNIGES